MNLISVYERRDRHELLYRLLSERDETINISHKAMPAFCQHVAFVESKPYTAWYFITENDEVHGACYLSNQDEIGIHVFRASQGRGYGPRAVNEIIGLHGRRRYLANINPRNERSAALFANLGFKLVQHTFALDEPASGH
jgi:RimJ/RimL family protein N-acetyltransferase